MYLTCPECTYRRQPGDSGSDDICPACGLVFSKWLKRRLAPEEPQVVWRESRARRLGEWLRELLFHGPADQGGLFWAGRALAFAVLLVWGGYFVLLEMQSNEIGASFLHGINLVFHEAGHVLFRPFGWFMTVLGGSLLQVLVPLIVCGAFLWHRNPFGASVGLWWAGQSLMDLAPYVNDARALALPLLGGGTGMDRPGSHDWENILGYLDLLESDHAIASAVDLAGEVLVVLALAWGASLLWLQAPWRR